MDYYCGVVLGFKRMGNFLVLGTWISFGDGFFFFLHYFMFYMFFPWVGLLAFSWLGPFLIFCSSERWGCPLHDFYGFCTTSNGKTLDINYV